MITKELEEYIRAELAKGLPIETIKKNLLSGGGWHPDEIDRTYQAIVSGAVIATESMSSKKKSFVGPVIVALLLLLGAGAVYAYYAGYFTPLEQVTTQSLVAARNATSASFDTTISVDLSGLKESEASNPVSGMFGKSMSFTTKGSYDVSDPENTKLSLILSFIFGTTNAEVEMRTVDGVAYAQLTKAPTISFLPILSSSERKWVSFPYKSETNTLTTIPGASMLGVNPQIFEKLTDDQKQELYAITANANFITITKKLTPEIAGDALSYHFTFDIDRAGVAKYLEDIRAYVQSVGKNDSLLATFDPTTYTADLDKVTNFSGEMWIGKKDKLPRKLIVTFDINNEKQGVVSITLASIFTAWNKPVVVEVPTQSVTFKEFIANMFSGSTDSTPSASVNTNERGNDAAVKAVLSNSRATAELYYDSNTTNGYSGYCASSEFTTMKNEAVKYNREIVCNDSNTAWGASAQLANNKHYCVDSTGVVQEIAQPIFAYSCIR